MKQRQQATITYPIPFLMIATTDHLTGLTGLAPSAWLSKNSASFVTASGAISEAGSGWYWLAGASGDRDTLGELVIHIAASADADPLDLTYTIVPWDPFDSVRLGLTALPNAAAFAADGLPSASGNWNYSTRTVTGGSVSVNAIDSAVSASIADAALTRDWELIADTAASRSSINALRALRNKWSISGAILTITEEDDTTPAWTANLTSSSDANPVTGVAPA